MTKRKYRLFPPYGKMSVQEVQWNEHVEGILISLPMAESDYIEIFVNGKLLREDLHYERVIEADAKGILWLPKFKCPKEGWSIVKIYKKAGKTQE